MKNPLPTDATFSNLRTSRAETERFVRNVLGQMRKAQKDLGEIMVRMGITGTGIAPNYRFEEAAGRPIVAIDGATHQPWPDGESFAGSENWSSVAVSYKDVESILRSLTGYTGPGIGRS